MDNSLYLQVISIFMGVIALAVPRCIAFIGSVYYKRITERIDNLADDVDQLWNRMNDDLNRKETASPCHPSNTSKSLSPRLKLNKV